MIGNAAVRVRALPAASTAAIALGLSASLLAGCSAVSRDLPDPSFLTIGLVVSLSGPDVGRAVEAVQGAQLAVEVVNQNHPELPLPLARGAGVRGGSLLSLAVGDADGMTDQASSRAGWLTIKQHALGIVTTDRTEVVRSVVERAETLHTPVVDASAAPASPAPHGRQRYFRINPADGVLARTVFGLLQRQRAGGHWVRKITVVAPGGGREAGMLASIREHAIGSGYDATSAVPLGDPAADPQSLARRVQETGADAAFAVVSTVAEANAVARLAGRARDRPILFAIGPAAGAIGATGPGVNLLRVVSWSRHWASRNPTASAVADLYQRRFGVPITESAAMTFTAVLTLASAIDAAAAATLDGVTAALRRTWLPAVGMIMPWGGVRFGADGGNELAGAVIEQRAASGFRLVYPTELATGPVVWPWAAQASVPSSVPSTAPGTVRRR